MRRDELTELHFIAPIQNLSSILEHGLLSHNGVKRIRHATVAMQAVQDRREAVAVPSGLKLHDYVNLYICARNPMMFLRRAQHNTLCVLSVSSDVLDIPGAVVTDQNAASNYVRFAAAPAGLQVVDHARTFALNWTHPADQIEEWRHKAKKCAEVLVPNRVDPELISHIYVSGNIGRAAVACCCSLETRIDTHLFFQ